MAECVPGAEHRLKADAGLGTLRQRDSPTKGSDGETEIDKRRWEKERHGGDKDGAAGPEGAEKKAETAMGRKTDPRGLEMQGAGAVPEGREQGRDNGEGAIKIIGREKLSSEKG